MSNEKSKKSSTPVLKNKGTDDPYKLTKLEKIQHYNAVLIEELRAQFGSVIDRVVALDEKFTQMFKDHAEENRQNFAEIRFTFKKVFEEFEENNKRWKENQSEHQKIIQEQKVVSEKVGLHDLILKKICA